MKTFKLIIEILLDWYHYVCEFIKNNLRNFANVIIFITPFLCLFLGQYNYATRSEYAIGGEIFIPFISIILASLLRSYSNKIGKGSDVPVPHKRFTKSDPEFGEVFIENNDVQEVILYLNDLEDWIDRKGLRK